ncbi:hypothetical protein [Robertkochia flava]|uniref:hypothetical protein n=1 Tax=Robertkochia flava TaxID=3447986 RepID=UPI001CCF1BDA|nr:hypothetical protein [Robertkochia marina]
MKIFNIVLIVLAFALVIYNATLIDFSNPFEGDSTVAIIGVVASLCAILLLVILSISRQIQDKVKGKK